MTKIVRIENLLLFILTASISRGNITVFADESSKLIGNVDTFAISRNSDDSKNNESHYTNIVNKSIFDSFNNGDDGDDTLRIEMEKMFGKGRKLRRGKRFLDFVKGTRVSWRTTVKNNILKINTLWGYGFGFRSNFPFPDKADRVRPFFKRDLLHSTVDMLNGHGLDGRACLLKSYCMAKLDDDSPIGGGMIFKLLKMLLR